MKTVRITADLTYDADIMHGDDADSIEWFRNLMASEDLIVHSNEIGDEVGAMRIVELAADFDIMAATGGRNG